MAPGEARNEFLKCCGSTNWSNQMIEARPFAAIEALLQTADRIWWSLESTDWLEAFRSHPKIGANKAPPPVATDNGINIATQKWSAQEQSGVTAASDETIQALAQLNQQYEETFGFIFIICATGKSSEEMLLNLSDRMGNPLEKELHIAAAEQAKITKLRLEKLLNE